MAAVSVIFPVFFLLFLGGHARRRAWISHEQNEGAKRIALDILFPFLIYQVMVETNLEKGVFLEIIFLIFIWMLVYFLGGQLSELLPRDFQEIAPFLCLTCEGGAVALPLYISVVGKSYTANLIPFDIAGILINFIFVPLILMNKSIGERKLLPFARKIFTSSFILAVLFGVIMNASGLHQALMQNAGLKAVFDNTMEALTVPIGSLILFSLGYSMRLHKGFLASLFTLAGIRLLFCGSIILLFFLLFKEQMQNRIFSFGVIRYFLCPTGFPVPLQIKGLLQKEEQEEFVSAFISLFLLIALAAYALLVLFYPVA